MKRFMKFFEAGFTMALGTFLCLMAFVDVYDYLKIENSAYAAVAGLGVMWAGSAVFKLIRSVEVLEKKKRR